MTEEEKKEEVIIFAGFEHTWGDPPPADLALLDFDENRLKEWVAQDPLKDSGSRGLGYQLEGRTYERWIVGKEKSST
jgi:hypothetical protein